MKKFLFLMVCLSVFLSACNNKNQTQFNKSDNYSNYNTTRTINSNKQQKAETDISSFSSTIYIKESARQHNITITCSKLNNTIVKPGETFSFCNTVGKATPSEGYEKADIFDTHGNIIKGYGGGNCQISSTLYNAVLNVPNLDITERHTHSREVNYVPVGKDAAVAYGSVDFKFINNNDYAIKIYASNTPDSVDIKIVKL